MVRLIGTQPADTTRLELDVRPLDQDDIPGAAQAAAAGFEFDISDPPVARRWEQRLEHLLRTDPDGGFVADRDGQIIGVAQSMVREGIWCLSLLAVDPRGQSSGAGGTLMERTLEYGARSRAGLIVSSNDPRALRLYAMAGFELRPTLQAEGAVDRGALPPPHREIREGDKADLDALAEISRRVRGAALTPELAFTLGRGARLLRLGDRGYSMSQPEHGVWTVVALDPEAASALLWAALEGIGELDRPLVRWITGEQQWAIDVVLQAGLRLSAYGALAVRGDPGPLAPFIPSAPFA